MAIGRIGSYGRNYGYYQTLSQIRLGQALAKNPKIQESVKAVERASAVSSYYKNGGLDFLESYSSTMADVMDSANSLRDVNSKSVMSDLKTVSSDTDVADVSTRYPSRVPKEMTLDVEALAEAQVNASTGVKASEKASVDMDFEVSGSQGSVSVQVSAQNDDGTAKSNRTMLKEAAQQINAGKTGVRASVEEKDGVASLVLKGRETGTRNAFQVSGEMGAAGGAQEIKTEAANAQYSVTTAGNITRNYTSQSNDITLDTGRISAKLKATGETTVSRQQDSDKVASAVSDLVESYNNAVNFLKDNADHGSGVSRQLRQLEGSLGSTSRLDRLGLSVQEDGTLALDEEKLTQSLKKEPELTKNLISGTNGIAQNMFSRASGAMRTNAQSLVEYDLQEYEQESLFDPLQFMGNYSRMGTTQMNNHYMVGLLMNYLV